MEWNWGFYNILLRHPIYRWKFIHLIWRGSSFTARPRSPINTNEPPIFRRLWRPSNRDVVLILSIEYVLNRNDENEWECWLLCACAQCIQIDSCFHNTPQYCSVSARVCIMHWAQKFSSKRSSLQTHITNEWKFVVTANHKQWTNEYFSVQFSPCMIKRLFLVLLLAAANDKCVCVCPYPATLVLIRIPKVPFLFNTQSMYQYQSTIHIQLFLSLVQFRLV